MDDNEIFSVKNEELDLNRDLEFDVPREVIKVIYVPNKIINFVVK